MSTFKYFKNGQWNTVNGAITGDTLPIGTIVPFGSDTIPANWLLCDGSYKQIAQYPELYAVIGIKYGNRPDEFRLPDLRGRVPVGKSTDAEFDNLGETGGEKTHTLTTQEIPSHAHSYYTTPNSHSATWVSGVNRFFYDVNTTSDSNTYTITTQQTGGGQAHNNLQPYQVTNYIIKAYQSSGLVGSVVNTQTTSDIDAYSCNYVNDMKPQVLYNNATGSNGSITLSDYIYNYESIKIYYRNNDNVYNSLDIYIGKQNVTRVFSMGSWTSSNNIMYFKYKCSTMNGKSISNYGSTPYIEYYQSSSGISWSGNNNLIYIVRVEGYK